MAGKTLPFPALEMARSGARMMGKRKELWALPILATCCSMVAWGLGWYLVVGAWVEQGLRSWMPLVLVPTWLLAAFSHIYFQLALAHALTNNDREVAMDEGLGVAWGVRGGVAGWALVNGLARGLLVLVGRQAGGLPGLAWLGGMAWTTATFLVIPLLGRGERIGQAMMHSVEIVRNRLADSIVGLGSLWIAFRLAQGLAGSLGSLAVWLFVMADHPVAGVGVGLVAGIVILGLIAVQEALSIAFAVQLIASQANHEAEPSAQVFDPLRATAGV